MRIHLDVKLLTLDLYVQIFVPYIANDQSHFLQAPQNFVLCCAASLESNSAALRYVFREVGTEGIFRSRPKVGAVLSLLPGRINGYSQTIHFLITCSTQRCFMPTPSSCV